MNRTLFSRSRFFSGREREREIERERENGQRNSERIERKAVLTKAQWKEHSCKKPPLMLDFDIIFWITVMVMFSSRVFFWGCLFQGALLRIHVPENRGERETERERENVG